MNFLIYANYPAQHCPGALYEYSVIPDGKGLSEPFYIIIPDTFMPRCTGGGYFLTPPGADREYSLSETLSNDSGMPEIQWIGRDGKRWSFAPGTLGI